MISLNETLKVEVASTRKSHNVQFRTPIFKHTLTEVAKLIYRKQSPAATGATGWVRWKAYGALPAPPFPNPGSTASLPNSFQSGRPTYSFTKVLHTQTGGRVLVGHLVFHGKSGVETGSRRAQLSPVPSHRYCHIELPCMKVMSPSERTPRPCQLE